MTPDAYKLEICRRLGLTRACLMYTSATSLDEILINSFLDPLVVIHFFFFSLTNTAGQDILNLVRLQKIEYRFQLIARYTQLLIQMCLI